VVPTTPCSTSPTLTKVDYFYCNGCRMAPTPRGETAQAGGGHPSYKRAHTQLFSMMRTQNVNDSVATPPSPSVPFPSPLQPSQLRSELHSLWIKLANPDNRSKAMHSSPPVSFTCHSQEQTTGMNRHAYTGHFHSSSPDAW
jgi:hypothetical protein